MTLYNVLVRKNINCKMRNKTITMICHENYQIYLIVFELLKEESITTQKIVLKDMRRKKKRMKIGSK